MPGGNSSFSEPQAETRDHIGDADALQGVDIGAVIDAGGGLDMAAAMARQEHHVHAMEGAGEKLVGGLAPGALHRLPVGIFQAGDLIDAGTADDAENRFGHEKGRFP